MLSIEQWALMWGVPSAALTSLRQVVASYCPPDPDRGEKSEAAVQERVRLEASYRGDIMLYRNNVGALVDDRGVPIRYGLANESKKMNELIKSADLIGIYRRVIRPEDVGTVIGQFVSVEAKEEGWTFTGQGREEAQMTWANSIHSYGGYATFYAGGVNDAFASLPKFSN